MSFTVLSALLVGLAANWWKHGLFECKWEMEVSDNLVLDELWQCLGDNGRLMTPCIVGSSVCQCQVSASAALWVARQVMEYWRRWLTGWGSCHTTEWVIVCETWQTSHTHRIRALMDSLNRGISYWIFTCPFIYYCRTGSDSDRNFSVSFKIIKKQKW